LQFVSEDKHTGKVDCPVEGAPASGETGAYCQGRLRLAPESGRRENVRPDLPLAEPIPVWLAVLRAAGCLATGRDGARDVRWICASGRATYTNAGLAPVCIEPLGVQLPAGHTLAVSWGAGETEYSTEVYRRGDPCA